MLEGKDLPCHRGQSHCQPVLTSAHIEDQEAVRSLKADHTHTLVEAAVLGHSLEAAGHTMAVGPGRASADIHNRMVLAAGRGNHSAQVVLVDEH